MARIRFKGLEKRFGAQGVLAPLDLEIADGEFFTFVGPSGCGKSTLLNLIAGVEAPSAGELWFDELPPAAAGVDIFQYRFRSAPAADARATPLLSMVTDLSVDGEALAARFGKDCRYKVRRADSKDALAFEFSAEPEAQLDAFADFFDAFARQKGHTPCDRHWLRAACGAGCRRSARVLR